MDPFFFILIFQMILGVQNVSHILVGAESELLLLRLTLVSSSNDIRNLLLLY